MNKVAGVEKNPISKQADFSACKYDFQFRLTRGENKNSWMAWVLEDTASKKYPEAWRQLRPAETTFDSAQMAIFDEMIAKAFPRE